MKFPYIETADVPYDNKANLVAHYVAYTKNNYDVFECSPSEFISVVYDSMINVDNIDFKKLTLLKDFIVDNVTEQTFDISKWYQTTPTDLLTIGGIACGAGWAGVVPGITGQNFRPVKRPDGYTLEYTTIKQDSMEMEVKYGIFAVASIFKISYPIACWLFAPTKYPTVVISSKTKYQLLIDRLNCLLISRDVLKMPLYQMRRTDNT